MHYAHRRVIHSPQRLGYLRIKAEFPDTLVFYRMRDLYEGFYDDTRRANRLLARIMR